LRNPERVRRRVAGLARRRLDNTTRVVAGHAPYGLHTAHASPDAVYLTVLRDPVDQTLSFYHFLIEPERYGPQYLPSREGPRLLPLPRQGIDLAEMLEQGLYLLDNLATRRLSDRQTAFGELRPEDLQQAKENLARKSTSSAGNAFSNPDAAGTRVQGLAASPRRSRVVIGHVPYGELRAHFGDGPRYTTILREPVDRTLSHYYWLIGSDLDDTNVFATRAGPARLPNPTRELSVRDARTRRLSARQRGNPLALRESPYGDRSSDDLEDAKRNLRERFDLVGLMERLPESIVLLERMLGLELVPFTSEKVNRSRLRVDDVPEGLKSVIEEHNRLDLYSLAKALSEQRVAAAAGLQEDPTS